MVMIIKMTIFRYCNIIPYKSYIIIKLTKCKVKLILLAAIAKLNVLTKLFYTKQQLDF